MTYTTAAALADRFGVGELADVAAPPDQVAVADDLLQATIDGADRSAWSAEEQAAADLTLAKLNQAIADAEALVDGKIGTRVALPLTTVPTRLAAVTDDIARWYLYDEAIPETVQRRYDAALRWLDAVRDGKESLTAKTASGGNAVQGFTAGDDLFSRSNREF